MILEYIAYGILYYGFQLFFAFIFVMMSNIKKKHRVLLIVPVIGFITIITVGFKEIITFILEED